jgi:hypothetical protein
VKRWFQIAGMVAGGYALSWGALAAVSHVADALVRQIDPLTPSPLHVFASTPLEWVIPGAWVWWWLLAIISQRTHDHGEEAWQGTMTHGAP